MVARPDCAIHGIDHFLPLPFVLKMIAFGAPFRADTGLKSQFQPAPMNRASHLRVDA
jgi:hypothetical protein